MQTTLVSASSDRVGYLPPEQDTASDIRAGGLEPWLLLLEAYPTVAARVRARVEAVVAAVPHGDDGLLTGAETGRFNAR